LNVSVDVTSKIAARCVCKDTFKIETYDTMGDTDRKWSNTSSLWQ
jgi:hypothetical protein